MRLTTKSLIVELFKSVSTCFDWSHIERFYLTREIGGKILRTISLFILETDYPSETGYPSDNSRSEEHTSELQSLL